MSLISTDFAEKNLKEFKIIDASWHLPTENRDPYLEYKESHIPNSVFFDLDNTSEKNTDLPHMLPSEDQWSKSISKLGISNNDKILIYDNSRLYSACRCWFSLLYFGHDIGKLYILNGGLKKWKQENKVLTDEKTNIVTSNYKAIKKIRDFEVSSFAKSINNDDLVIEKSPLEILINEFKDDICSGNSSPNDLNLAVNIVDILKKVEEILKDQ